MVILIYFILCWINQHAFAHTGNVQLLELFQQLKKNQTTSMYNIGFYEKPSFNEYTKLICSQLRFEFILKIIKSMIHTCIII